MEINLNSIKNELKGTITQKENGEILYLDSTKGTGFIAYHHLQQGLATLNIQVTAETGKILPLQFLKGDNLEFVFCQEGSVLYQVANDVDNQVQIDQYQTAVLQRSPSTAGSLLLTAGQTIKLRMIVVDKKNYFNNFDQNPDVSDQNLQDILTHIKDRSTYTQVGSFDLSIAEQYKQIEKTQGENEVSDSLSQKGRYYIILAKHIQKFCSEMKDPINESGLSKNELKRVIDLSNRIKEQPEASHNIRLLCQSSGLSPAKIQEGFKYLFANTVSNYVCEIRLEKAEELIRYSDLTISEIVYTVGLTSRSYFCKIFKKKYNYSPKDYRNRIKDQITAATFK